MLGVPSPILVPKQVCLVHDLGLKKEKEKHTMYPVQYLRKNTTTRVPGLGPTAKFVGTMVQAPKIKGSSMTGKKKPGALEMDLGKGENALLP